MQALINWLSSFQWFNVVERTVIESSTRYDYSTSTVTELFIPNWPVWAAFLLLCLSLFFLSAIVRKCLR